MQQEYKKSLKGIRAVTEVLRAEDFPADKSDLAYSIGDIPVEDARGHYIPVRDILDSIEQDEFRSAEDAVRAIRTALEKIPRQIA